MFKHFLFYRGKDTDSFDSRQEAFTRRAVCVGNDKKRRRSWWSWRKQQDIFSKIISVSLNREVQKHVSSPETDPVVKIISWKREMDSYHNLNAFSRTMRGSQKNAHAYYCDGCIFNWIYKISSFVWKKCKLYHEQYPHHFNQLVSSISPSVEMKAKTRERRKTRRLLMSKST